MTASQVCVIEAAEDGQGILAQSAGEPRVELGAAALLGQQHRGLDAADPVRDLDVLGQLGQPGGDRHRITA
jgi:hypothetical protein